MARHSRKFTPRERNRRPLGLENQANKPPSTPLAPAVERDGFWYIAAPLASRLHQKSALGQTTSDGGILLTLEEVMFCHWNRHVPLASDDWFVNNVASTTSAISAAVVFDVARSGGEKLVPAAHLQGRKDLCDSTWAMRWQRDSNPNKAAPNAQCRFANTTDSLDMMELLNWAEQVTDLGQIPELYVVDEEMDVTMYRLNKIELSGQQITIEQLSKSQIDKLGNAWASRIQRENGWYIIGDDWPLPSLGQEQMSGRLLRNEEGVWLENKLNSSSSSSGIESLFNHLMSQGCILRPGFKYGCRWRVYDESVASAHAPWLLQELSDVSSTWEGICLSVRLAEAVHKEWVCAIDDGGWKFLSMRRWLPGKN